MLKINYDHVVAALWDPDLKKELHEIYYDKFPVASELPHDFMHRVNAVRLYAAKMTVEMVIAVAMYFIDIEEPDPREFEAFVKRYSRLIIDRIGRILDNEELDIEVKRRGLLR